MPHYGTRYGTRILYQINLTPFTHCLGRICFPFLRSRPRRTSSETKTYPPGHARGKVLLFTLIWYYFGFHRFSGVLERSGFSTEKAVFRTAFSLIACLFPPAPWISRRSIRSPESSAISIFRLSETWFCGRFSTFPAGFIGHDSDPERAGIPRNPIVLQSVRSTRIFPWRTWCIVPTRTSLITIFFPRLSRC